jgi:signal transduction histidine kinase
MATLAEDDLKSGNRAGKLGRILLLAFGGLLALMIVAGVAALHSLRQLDGIEQQINQHHSAHSRALTTILITIHAYHDQMNRYLLNTGSLDSRIEPADVQKYGASVHNALQLYPADANSEEQALLVELQKKITEQESSFAIFVSQHAGDKSQERLRLLGEQMVLRRVYILQVSQRVSDLNDKEQIEAKQSLAASFQNVQTRLVSTVSLSLLAGLLMSLVGGFHILRLEKQGRIRYQELVASQKELESLSARLVDAQEEERRSISRELHDEVGQTMGALLMDLGQLSRLIPTEDNLLQEQITRIKSAAETALKSIRDLALLLRPPMLEDLGLVPALEWQAREISRRGDMEVDVHSAKVSEQLADDAKVCVYRLVQEALTNAARHSGAKRAKVSIVQSEGTIRVQIADDGISFSPQRARGMGILGMEERVKRLGGSLTIESAPGKGTTVRAEIPAEHSKPV